MLKLSICAILFTFFQTPKYNVATDADGYNDDDQDVQDGYFDNGDADDGENDDSVVSK